MAMCVFCFVQNVRRTKTSESALYPRKTVSCMSAILTGLCSKWTLEIGQLQVRNLPETLPSLVSAIQEKGAGTSCFKVHEKQSEMRWSRSAQSTFSCDGGSLSHSKCPTKPAKHGEGCVFSRSQKSCFRRQSGGAQGLSSHRVKQPANHEGNVCLEASVA